MEKRLLYPIGVPGNKITIGIGDLHGYYPALEALMENLDEELGIFSQYGILDDEVQIVTTGDYIDRGNEGLRVINHLKRLQKDNPKKVFPLMGNHEILALRSLDFARECALGKPQVAETVEEEFDPSKTVSWNIYSDSSDPIERYHQCTHGSNGGARFIEEFGPDSLSAIKSYIERMSRGGDIGDWVRNLSPFHITRLGKYSILFMHANPPEMDLFSLLQFGNGFYATMGEESKQYGTELKYGNDNPRINMPFFKNRCSEFKDIHKYLKTDFIVYGHNPHNEIVNHDGCFDIDVGMTPAYGQNDPAAIVFKNDGIYEYRVEQESTPGVPRILNLGSKVVLID